MRKGITTGTSAAVAAVGHAIWKLKSEKKDHIRIQLPKNLEIEVQVQVFDTHATVIKDAGDDPDVTHLAEVCASVTIDRHNSSIRICGGLGVGTVTKPGLQIPIGEPAINPVPRKMIEENLRRVLGDDIGAVVKIFVPQGKEIAKKTFNERIGILGGISIIGTTGIVEPMSLDAIFATIRCEIDVRLASSEKLYLVPGKIGERHLQQRFPEASAVMVSNYFNEAFQYLQKKKVNRIMLAGHPGKLAKLAMGYYNTHSKYSPQANDFVREIIGLKKEFNTVEEICQQSKPGEMDQLAKLIQQKIFDDYSFKKVSILLFDMQGNLMGQADEPN